MTQCLYSQRGVVEQVYYPGKAILQFLHNGKVQRALLWVKCYHHQGRLLDQAESFMGKLNIGEVLYFDCHSYDKESKDNCQWYAAKASKEMPEEHHPKVSKVVNQNGYIFELEPGKGVIVFDFYDKEQRVFFLRSKFFLFGKRPSNKRSLKEFLSENDPLQFDADECEPSDDNFSCQWFATVVWKGKKPLGYGSGWTAPPPLDDITADDSASNVGGTLRDMNSLEDFPSLTHSHPIISMDKQDYKAFEVSTNSKDGKGNVLHLFNEECGIALWMVRRNTWETVFFHRKNSFLDNVSLSKFDLRESFSEGTALDICAVPAIPEFPCRWIAQKAVAKC